MNSVGWFKMLQCFKLNILRFLALWLVSCNTGEDDNQKVECQQRARLNDYQNKLAVSFSNEIN